MIDVSWPCIRVLLHLLPDSPEGSTPKKMLCVLCPDFDFRTQIPVSIPVPGRKIDRRQGVERFHRRKCVCERSEVDLAIYLLL
jgi:hypothetical protein